MKMMIELNNDLASQLQKKNWKMKTAFRMVAIIGKLNRNRVNIC